MGEFRASFSRILARLSIPQGFIVWNETRPYWRTGLWNGKVFTGLPTMRNFYLSGIRVEDDGQGNVDLSFIQVKEVGFIINVLNSKGIFQEVMWKEEKQEWEVTWNSYQLECDVYGVCGPSATCNSQRSPICSCLRGVKEPVTKNKSADNKADGFLKLQMVKVPDFADGSFLTLKPDAYKSRCLENCSCVAYSYDAEIGCMSWTGNLIDIAQFSYGGLDLHVRVAHTELDKDRNMTVIITITVTVRTAIIVISRKNRKRFLQFNRDDGPVEYPRDDIIGELSHVKLQELLIFNFEKLLTATNNFHPSNKLGQGGFGLVYKILDLPPPRKPAFVLRQNMLSSMSFEQNNGLHSLNSASISNIQGR
ncbi:hypothetical protein VNO77_19630 [Canavalia gladiata]|uniref:Uncharacterized protein n=1 Tax=Canavalia gladiata TaxID=3824 RepID=A0AAN9LRA2_CANGL